MNYTETATKMLRAASMPAVEADVSVLAADIEAVAGDLTDRDYDVDIEYAAAYELERRIGGLKNLSSYMACLWAQS